MGVEKVSLKNQRFRKRKAPMKLTEAITPTRHSQSIC